MQVISIHALREEGDPECGAYQPLVWISIHALREEGDPYGWMLLTVTVQFLSTPSARRATKSIKATQKRIEEFLSTPSARRATD